MREGRSSEPRPLHRHEHPLRRKTGGYGEGKRAEYTAEDHHKPSDETKPDWDLAGAVEDLRLLFEVGYRVTEAEAWPIWKEGTEFKALREARLEAAEGRR